MGTAPTATPTSFTAGGRRSSTAESPATLLLLLAAARAVCGLTARGATRHCVALATEPIAAVLALVGLVAAGYGLRLCWSAVRT